MLPLVEAALAQTNTALIWDLILFALADTQDVGCLGIAAPHPTAVEAVPTTAVCALWELAAVARTHLQEAGRMAAAVVAGAAEPLQMVAVAAALPILPHFLAW